MSTQLLLEILRQPRLLLNYPRGVWALIGVVCIGLLSFGLYLQHVVGLVPCPMCIVQRYAMVLMALVAVLGAGLPGRKTALIAGSWLVAVRMWRPAKRGFSGTRLRWCRVGATSTA